MLRLIEGKSGILSTTVFVKAVLLVDKGIFLWIVLMVLDELRLSIRRR